MKTLAICIPTYRRPALLERCIVSALASANGKPITVVVADDSMSDANIETMTRLCSAHHEVRWHRNARNLGIDDNIQHVVDLCEADFAWLIGEDDMFLPGAVATMLDRLQTLDAPFLFANYRYVDDSMQRVLGNALEPTTARVLPRTDFIEAYLWAVGFIGACVLRTKSWRATDPAPYHGTYYTHVGRIAELLAGLEEVPLVVEPCVSNRVEGQDTFTWKSDSYGVYVGFMAMCRRVGERVPTIADSMSRAAAETERRYRWLSLRLAMRLRSENAFDQSQYRRYIQGLPMSAIKRGIFLAISLAPPVLFRPAVWLFRSLRA